MQRDTRGTQAQRDDDVKRQQKDGHLQAKERGSRGALGRKRTRRPSRLGPPVFRIGQK